MHGTTPQGFDVRRVIPPETEAGEVAAILANNVLSEDKVALVFIDRHHRDLRFDHDRKRWYVWTGTRWQEDPASRALSFARTLSRDMSASEAQTVQKNAGRAGFAAGVERLAQSDQRIAVTSGAWDGNPNLLGTPGGVVDLRDGRLNPARREDLITRHAAEKPAEKPMCPLWLDFLSQATGQDEALVRFLKHWVGYSLTGDTTEHQLAFLHGDGGNGKGVFINTVSSLLGDYAKAASMDTFMAAFGDRHPEELATLRGTRMVSASETKEGRRWAEARVKALTGGDVTGLVSCGRTLSSTGPPSS